MTSSMFQEDTLMSAPIATVTPNRLLTPSTLAAGGLIGQRGTKATRIFSSVNLPHSMITSLSSATVQSRIGTS